MSGHDSPGRGDRLIDVGVQALIAVSALTAGLVGAVIVYALVLWVLPDTDVADESSVALRNLVGVAIYLGLVTPVLTWRTVRRQRRSRDWLREGRPPTNDELRTLLRAPVDVARAQLIGWLGAAVLFSVLNARTDTLLGVRVGVTTGLAGLTTAAVAYLLAERLLRPLATRALSMTALDRPALPGVAARILVSWALACGVPLTGLGIVAISALVDDSYTVTSMAVTMLVLAGVALLVGALALSLAVRSTSRPIVAVRQAMAEVADGNLDAHVPVDDATELGLLESGFNAMAAGLRERERMRDVFGRHVGVDVAREAMEGDLELGGELREAAVLFVDLVGSTHLAVERPPEEVVGLLNTFFGIVVRVVDDHGGWVNKFEGDAALAVFGAPRTVEDAPDRALAAARALHSALGEDLDGLRAGIGVSFGSVVAGNLGSPERLEYTVIGDVVNVAARLTEHAKTWDPMVLASGDAVDAAGEDESRHWQLRGEVELRGRDRPTRLATPTG